MHPYLASLLGGALIGLSASLVLLGQGRIAGISGIVSGLVSGAHHEGWRAAFLVGLVGTGGLLTLVAPGAFTTTFHPSMPTLVLAGALVGYGTRLGSGCTAGHGVCGLSRGSLRSLTAVVVFIAVGVATVALVRLVGGAP